MSYFLDFSTTTQSCEKLSAHLDSVAARMTLFIFHMLVGDFWHTLHCSVGSVH